MSRVYFLHSTLRTALLFFCLLTAIDVAAQNNDQHLPLSTQLTIASSNVYNKDGEILNVFLITNSAKDYERHGTGFLIKSGQVVTCAHVVKGAKSVEINLLSPNGVSYAVKSLVTDTIRDLALLTLYVRVPGGYELGVDSRAKIGTQVFTWGYPFGYMGPEPLFSAGYLSGITAQGNILGGAKRFVVNGAFNPGNSGGPLIDSGRVIGVVQSKSTPTTAYIQSALNALRANPNGVSYIENKDGKTTQYSEAQIIEKVLTYYREVTQVMIGEAIAVDDLKLFLQQNNVSGY